MTPRERLFGLEQFGIKLGLENITALLGALGRPDRAYPTVHVAGTNGKGSVTAMVERGLRAAGHRTGRYTSPHLATIEERVAIDGASIDPALFDDLTADVLKVADRLQSTGVLPHPPTFFEATTALAFEAFRRQRVSVGVIEVGLGGRFDATNVIQPSATAITSIALDHERHLGSSLRSIATEKAGIIKPGVPVVAGPMPHDAAEVIDETARAVGAPLIRAEAPPHGTPVQLALAGRYQRDNAAVAVAVLRLCSRLGRPIAQEHLITALTTVEWPARLEWLRLPDGHDVLLDAAHNPAGAEALADYVTMEVGRLPIVLGVMEDKDVVAMVRALAPAASRFIATAVPSRRAMTAPALADRVRQTVPGASVASQNVPQQALAAALDAEPRAAVAGSIFLVGPVRAELLAGGAAPVRYPSKAAPFYLN